jgi:hypothetical protein
VASTADPLYDLPAGEGWKFGGAVVDVAGKFIESSLTE